MHIHYEHTIDMDTVVELFAELHPRRLQLSSVLFESRYFNVYIRKNKRFCCYGVMGKGRWLIRGGVSGTP